MTTVHRQCSGFVVLRTPLLPFDTLVDWAEGARSAACSASDGALEDALRADRALLRERLLHLVRQPEVKEAITLASPGMTDVLRDPVHERFRLAEGALVRYLLRMSARPTPFGLMAGISFGNVESETQLALAPRAYYRRTTELDGASIAAVGAALVADAKVRAELEFRPNPDLYELAGELRYFVAASADAHSFRLNAVERSPFVDAALARAKKSARPKQIATAVVARGHDRVRALAFVDAMIDARVLVSDVEAPVTGEAPLAELGRTLRRGGASCRRTAENVERIGDALRKADSTGLVAPPDAYSDARDALERLAPLGHRAPFQADLLKPTEGLRLDPSVVAEVFAGVRVLHRIGVRSRNVSLDRFRAEYEHRYGSRQVRLVDALDPECGIGFSPAPADERWTASDSARLELLRRAWADAGETKTHSEVVLSSSDLDALSGGGGNRPAPLPDALAALVTLVAPSDAALRRGDYRFVLHSVHGPSGARLLGRACRVDPAVHAAVAAHLREEERLRPGVSFFEVVLLPKQHHRNVMGRPVLRDYELSFACRSGAAPDQQLPLADVLLGVDGERIVLRSARLGRELVPRISSAINVEHPEGHPILRFLGALQGQGTLDFLRFDWGPLAAARFAPRVSHGRAVFSLARWVVGAERLRGSPTASEADAFRRVQAVRAEFALPRYVSVEDGDAPLALDLDNPLCVDALLRVARSGKDLSLVEIYPEPEEMCVRGPEGRYAHELVVPFVAAGEVAETPRPRPTPPLVANGARRRIPGTDWLYAKVYAAAAPSDRLLCDVLAPVLRRGLRSGAVDRWFFVRYADPEPHLRVRAHGPARRLVAEVLPSIASATKRLLDDGRVSRVVFDTYEREVERFGGLAALDVAERVFWLDTEAVVAFLKGRPTLGERRQWALVGVDRMLRALGLELAERTSLVGTARDALSRELDGESTRRERGVHFRAERAAIAALLASSHESGASGARWRRAFGLRDAGLSRASRRLRALERESELQTSLTAIFSSYIHLHVNRLFPANQRKSELLALDLLHRHYTGSASLSRPER